MLPSEMFANPPGGVLCLLRLLARHPDLTQELAA
jgi:putative transcriptional regulator